MPTLKPRVDFSLRVLLIAIIVLSAVTPAGVMPVHALPASEKEELNPASALAADVVGNLGSLAKDPDTFLGSSVLQDITPTTTPAEMLQRQPQLKRG
jgi:hypothetical protein